MNELVLTAKMLSAETPSERSHALRRKIRWVHSGHCRPRIGTPTAPDMSSATRFPSKPRTNQIIHISYFKVLQHHSVFNVNRPTLETQRQTICNPARAPMSSGCDPRLIGAYPSAFVRNGVFLCILWLAWLARLRCSTGYPMPGYCLTAGQQGRDRLPQMIRCPGMHCPTTPHVCVDLCGAQPTILLRCRHG